LILSMADWRGDGKKGKGGWGWIRGEKREFKKGKEGRNNLRHRTFAMCAVLSLRRVKGGGRLTHWCAWGGNERGREKVADGLIILPLQVELS